LARGAKAESAGTVIDGDACEARSGQSWGKRSRLHRHERTVGVNDAVEPSVLNFKGNETAAGTQHAVNFRERAILLFAGPQMMQDKNGNRRGEGAVSKGQCCRIALHDAGAVSILLHKPNGGRMIVFEAGHASDEFSQFGGGSARASPDFEKVIAQIGAAQQPGQQSLASQPTPERRGATPIFEGVHSVSLPMGSALIRTFLGSMTTIDPRSDASRTSLSRKEAASN